MKRICRTLVVFILSAFLLLTTAPVTSAQMAGPFYVGVFGGFVMPDNLRLEWGYDESLDDSWAVGVKVGYIIPPVNYLAVELEYTYLGKQDYNDSYYAGFYGDERYSYNGNFSAHNLMANLLFRYPPGKVHPYVGFGIGLSRATIEENDIFESNGEVLSYHFDEDDTAFAGQFIAGLNFEIMANLSGDITYKYFYSEYEIEDWDAEANNHMFTLGVNYHF